jgi:aminoglycoside/choline kinase family phosphotransferase
MNIEQIQTDLNELFERWAKTPAKSIQPLTAHGSDRKYFRIQDTTHKAIGVYNADVKENIAFLNFSKHFLSKGLKVPEIYSQELDKNIYLEQDLGDKTLFDYLTIIRAEEGFSDKIIRLYEKIIEQLPRFQIDAKEGLDFSLCYPRHSFDRQSMMWDLNYFKYYFLKLAKVPFDEQHLENDFETFTDYLLSCPRDFFLYRDFQSRNIMLKDGEPFFIDYQGGRLGALQYDLASLIYDAKADIPQEVRSQLLEKYITEVSKYVALDKNKFIEFYYGYVLIRIMQALGAYGFRGFYERKEHFLKSVPYAIQNLEWLLHNTELPIELPSLMDAFNHLVRSSALRQFGNAKLKLTVRIQSFSYKRGIPLDDKGHGGGFVFDCRFLPNPGRLEEFKDLTGMDPPVIEYLQMKKEVADFLADVQSIITRVISNYEERNFTDVMFAFGCTGGQHRSVYCANKLAEFLNEHYNVNVQIRHLELDLKESGL